MSSLKVGLIGAGVFGGYHAGKIADSKRAQLAGVFDPDQSRAEVLAEKHETRVFESEAALHEACDGVIVACPAIYHDAVVERALVAGLHVLVEKPLALSGARARELAALADEKGLTLQVGHQERFVLAAMGFFDIAEVPVSIEAVRESPPSPEGRAGDVSVIWDLMIHDLDMAAKLIGVGASVSGEGSRQHTDHIDEAVARLDFPSDAKAVIRASRVAPERRRAMTVIYPSGTISIDFLTRKVENTTPHAIKADVSADLPDPLGAADEAFFAACLGERETPIPGREAAEAVRLAELVEQTALQKIGA
ncbi:Gfo/Idh/MocA family protein [Henriciella aquimarina]|uniref:Gfo/Idh/MocA family protein n=1 Tax=Henriciella aquimarina TaxID=545261 RepID=UPI0009FE5627|nr:Gfo/Idh/MocA family oxidoreductase [Henriciella aquimarina]